MKILVLSDSHSALSFMRRCVNKVKPHAMIHLGDFYEDGQAIGEEFPHIPLHQVPGNCDLYRMVSFAPDILIYPVCGVEFYMTHGHKHGVKMTLANLLREARKTNAKAVLYGHTHIADCHQEEDGLWVLNPGSCGNGGGSVGLIEIQDNAITACCLVSLAELEGTI